MRQNIEVDPARKVFEAFVDFSGGLNSEITNERLRPNEFPVCTNADLSGRASARLRYGRTLYTNGIANAQGIFFFYRSGQANPDLVGVFNGRLYVQVSGTTMTEVTMFDGSTPITVQTTRHVEGVQYRDYLYIATGTKLIELYYDSQFKARVVTPYKPTVMEGIYIGTNALSPDPDGYIQDGVSSTSNVEAIGIRPEYSYAAQNEPIDMTAYVAIPSGYGGTIDYKWEHKSTSDTTWIVDKDFTAGYKTHTYSFNSIGQYDIRVTVRKTGDATVPGLAQQYMLGNFEVRPVADRSSKLPSDGIHSCNHIMLHWDRILMYGDSDRPYQLYISDLENPYYFPTDNTISFDIGRQEEISTAVRFQDMLVFFTKTSIQTLTGKSTDDYARYLINDTIGCTAGWSAKVVVNKVYFLSHEGVHELKPNPYRLETMNVGRIDANVRSEMPTDANACGAFNDSMYWIAFPDKSIVYRYYFENNVWVKDVSTSLNIRQFLTYGDDCYNMTSDGHILKHDRAVFTDNGVNYPMEIETKSHDLSATFNYKKLKRIYLLARAYQDFSSDLYLTILADSIVSLTPESGHAQVLGTGEVVWLDTTAPNFHFRGGTTFGSWELGESVFGEVSLSVSKASIRGKCRRVKLKFRTIGGHPFELFGFGLEFKLKKP
jgi:hypothetical protein